MRNELATYRVQLCSSFTLDHAAAIAEYLAQLGISHLYSSPVLQAVKGSTHGYDVLDHSRVNRELGGEAGFERYVGWCVISQNLVSMARTLVQRKAGADAGG